MVRVDLNDQQRRFSAVQLRPTSTSSSSVLTTNSNNGSENALSSRFVTMSDVDDSTEDVTSGRTRRRSSLCFRDVSGVGIVVSSDGANDAGVAGRVTVSGAGISLLNTKDSPFHRSLPAVCPIPPSASISTTSAVSTDDQPSSLSVTLPSDSSTAIALTSQPTNGNGVSLSRSQTIHIPRNSHAAGHVRLNASSVDAIPASSSTTMTMAVTSDGVVACSQASSSPTTITDTTSGGVRFSSASFGEIGVAGANVLSVAINGGHGAGGVDSFGGSAPHLPSSTSISANTVRNVTSGSNVSDVRVQVMTSDDSAIASASGSRILSVPSMTTASTLTVGASMSSSNEDASPERRVRSPSTLRTTETQTEEARNEAQQDFTALDEQLDRETRRRLRRERRQQRRAMVAAAAAAAAGDGLTQGVDPAVLSSPSPDRGDRHQRRHRQNAPRHHRRNGQLPDLLNSHVPPSQPQTGTDPSSNDPSQLPPYSTLPHSMERTAASGHGPPPLPPIPLLAPAAPLGALVGAPVGASPAGPPQPGLFLGRPPPPPPPGAGRRWMERHQFPMMPAVRRTRSNNGTRNASQPQPPSQQVPPSWPGLTALGLTTLDPVSVAATSGPHGLNAGCASHLLNNSHDSERQSKGCCGSWSFSQTFGGGQSGAWGATGSPTASIRWFILVIAFVGLCCAVIGTVLGALKAAGREHLTVSLLMIGVGIVLMTVSAIAWRLTAHDAPTWRSMLGLSRSGPSLLAAAGVNGSSCPTGLNLLSAANGATNGAVPPPGATQLTAPPNSGGVGLGTANGVIADDPNNAMCEPRRFLGLTRLPPPPVAPGRHPPPLGIPPHLAPGSQAYNAAAAAAAAAMMYPEFQFRPPPPSYQASMQEYRLRLLLLDRHHSAPPAVSPPPTYRSNASTLRPGLAMGRENDVSRPPSYRSRCSSINPSRNGTTGHQVSPPGNGASHNNRARVHHSRDASLTASLLSQELGEEDPGAMEFNGNPSETATPLASPNIAPMIEEHQGQPQAHQSPQQPVGPTGTKWTTRDGNTVTILQTTDYSQVNGQESVIVTVSGLGYGLSSPSTSNNASTSGHSGTAATSTTTSTVRVSAPPTRLETNVVNVVARL